ncbi:MAG: DegT/DnrJ/EryC1/StrS family aminotransferase [Clostridia bacterium]|nr:DegT/DnrJ/EryC1/StrS family aminotransferase [Clostridia bacterium]
MQIPLSRPDITQKEIDLVNEVLNSSYLALGPKIKEFEEAFAGYVGRKFAVAVNSGTSGLHLLVRALGIGEGDEVITTPFSFIASSNCLLFERARPIFVDIDPLTLNMNVDLTEEKITEKTKAILAVDVFGHPVEMDKIEDLAAKYNLYVIEDACEAIGAKYKGRMAGSLGDGAVFAFYPNKQITTGEGGVIVTDNEEIAYLCRSMRNQGRGENSEWLAHERLGYNYRMDEMSAALGIAQLERIDEILEKRSQVACIYNEKFKGVEEVEIPYSAPEVKMSWFVYVIRLKKNIDRNRVMDYLRKNGVGCRAYFPPIHLQPFYREKFGYKEGDFPVTEGISKRTIALPFYNNLSEAEIDYVVKKLCEGIKYAKNNL